jgi:DnaJ-class molecular chaperone
MKNCYDCRFALKARRHFRHGEQVRCKKAEELFGGERWVNILPESKCGMFEDFVGDDSRAPEPTALVPKVKAKCNLCKGSGKARIQFMDEVEFVKCHRCDGKGEIILGDN